MRPRALAHQLHPGSTFGFIKGTWHQAGSGEGAGSRGLTYLLPRLAQSALRSWGALREAKHWEVERALGGPSQRRDPHSLPWEPPHSQGAGGDPKGIGLP